MKELLILRKQIKKKKPRFLRQDAHKKVKLKKKWRQPKGYDSKLRRKLSGKRRHPSIGFSSPRLVRGLHPSGLKGVIINNENELKAIKDGEGIIVSGKLGDRKRVLILKKILELKLPLLNIKNAKTYIENVENKLKQKKILTKQKEQVKKLAQEKSIKTADEKNKGEKKPEDIEKDKEEEIKRLARQKSMEQPTT